MRIRANQVNTRTTVTVRIEKRDHSQAAAAIEKAFMKVGATNLEVAQVELRRFFGIIGLYGDVYRGIVPNSGDSPRDIARMMADEIQENAKEFNPRLYIQAW